jgi:peptidoglycan/xylan/chitin deacetylase (PgdA/CDA1 family)
MSEGPTFASRAAELEKAFAGHPVIRAVNFHNTSRARLEHYDQQLAHYSTRFASVNQDELDEFLTSGRWHKDKPGLIVSVFEGYRNSYEVLTPLIEKYGFVGWYWVITGFINTPVREQLAYAERHDIDMLTHEYPDGRYALTWDELRQLDKRHVVACHTRSHTLLANLSPAVRREEVVGSQAQFTKHLGHPVRSFVSLTGPAYGVDAVTDRLVQEAGFDFVFSNFRIQKIRTRPGAA